VAGLGEFQLQGGGSLEITTFGLVPEYVGQGIGGSAALTLVLQRAWRHNGAAASGCTRRVQHPNALKTTTTAASGRYARSRGDGRHPLVAFRHRLIGVVGYLCQPTRRRRSARSARM
jgi:hypothetical protein